MDNITIQVGKNIRRLRRHRGLSQEQLAERADLHRVFVGQVERGEKCPSILTLEKIAQALEVEAGELLKRTCQNP